MKTTFKVNWGTKMSIKTYDDKLRWTNMKGLLKTKKILFTKKNHRLQNNI